MIKNYDINLMFMLLWHFSFITAELLEYTGSGTGNRNHVRIKNNQITKFKKNVDGVKIPMLMYLYSGQGKKSYG